MGDRKMCATGRRVQCRRRIGRVTLRVGLRIGVKQLEAHGHVFFPGLLVRKSEPQGKECCLRFSAVLCASAISALKAFAVSALKLNRGSGIQEGFGKAS